MNKTRIVKLLPLAILVGSIVIVLISVLNSEIILINQQIIGLSLLSINLLVQFYNEKIGYQLTGLLLLLGTLTFAAFTPSIYTVYFKISELKISFDYFCFAILILYIFVHRNELLIWIGEFIAPEKYRTKRESDDTN
jgi:hypothetical protein